MIASPAYILLSCSENSRNLVLILINRLLHSKCLIHIDIIQLADAFGARIVDIKADSIIIEASAEDSVTQSIVDTFEPYGIISLMKTGTVALKK